MLTPKTRAESRRVVWHGRASAGSSGQGAWRLRHCSAPLASSSISPAPVNRTALFSLSYTSCGTADTTVDKAALAPSATSKAGKAQHSSVLELANRLTMDDHKPDRPTSWLGSNSKGQAFFNTLRAKGAYHAVHAGFDRCSANCGGKKA